MIVPVFNGSKRSCLDLLEALEVGDREGNGDGMDRGGGGGEGDGEDRAGGGGGGEVGEDGIGDGEMPPQLPIDPSTPLQEYVPTPLVTDERKAHGYFPQQAA